MAKNNKQKRNVKRSGWFEDVKESIEEGVDKGAQAVVDFVKENTGLSGEAARDLENRDEQIDKEVDDATGKNKKRRRR